jgi:hypothetical protein
MKDVATNPIVVVTSFTTYDLPMLGGPVRQPRRVNQTAMEAEPLDRSSQSAPLVAGMDVPKPAAVRRPQAQPNLPTTTDPLAASSDFMAMSSRPRRAASPQIVVGGSPIPTPAVLQAGFEIEPMYAAQPARRPPRQHPSTSVLVNADLFGNLPDISSYQSDWIVPQPRPAWRAPPVESISTSVYVPTGSPQPFRGSGGCVVAAAFVGPAIRVAAACILRGAKGS